MKILVTTSDKYSFLLEPYCELFNKYWPNQEIIFLGFDENKAPPIPDNCKFHSLGVQKNFGRYWTDPLIPYINSLEDEHFIVTVEDMMLMNHVDVGKLEMLEREIISGEADKALLDICLNEYAEPHKNGILKLRADAPFRTTLHPCIWKKNYFQRYLKPNYTAWQFEEANAEESLSDGATIISLDEDTNLFESANVYRKGKPIPRYYCNLPYGCAGEVDMDDIELILSYIEEVSS